MKSRRQARNIVLQALYQCDAQGDYSDEAFNRFCDSFLPVDQISTSASGSEKADIESRDSGHIEFATRLFRGVRQYCAELDKAISACSSHWSLARMLRVDRNILRLAAYELLHDSEVPASVVINEAVELAKRFGSRESSMFVNGVLDELAKRVAQSALKAAQV